MNRSASQKTALPGVSLATLAARQVARITGFDLPPERRARLLEMGLTTGAEVELIRFAPLGDPIEIEVRGYRLSLRKREARGIRVACL
ncbi:MAG: ferrous iron transport protein A [Chthoniobacteraceae bacterium]